MHADSQGSPGNSAAARRVESFFAGRFRHEGNGKPTGTSRLDFGFQKLHADGARWQGTVYDPDGTGVEFMEFTPTQTPCCSPITAPRQISGMSTRMEASPFLIGHIGKTYYRDSRCK